MLSRGETQNDYWVHKTVIIPTLKLKQGCPSLWDQGSYFWNMPAFCMCIIKALSSSTQPPPGSSQLFSDSRKEFWELFSSNISCLLGISCDYMLSLVRYLSTLANTYNKGETSQRDVDGKEDERIWTSSTPEHSYRITVSLCLGYWWHNHHLLG